MPSAIGMLHYSEDTMTETNPDCFHLSASCIAAFKACPTRFRLAYREGLRLDTDSDSLRIGSNWHAMHETYQDARPDLDSELALGTTIEHLNKRYEELPTYKTLEEWEHERQVLVTCFVGYLWYYQNDVIEYLHQELPFDLPIHEPRTGRPLPTSRALRVGKIDHIIRWQGMLGNMERKSTARDIAPGSDYWDKSQKDTQVSMYALAMHDMHGAGLLDIEMKPNERFGNTLYDVWRRPSTKPTHLTQKATVEFIDTGEYYGQGFLVSGVKADEVPEVVLVDGVAAEIKPGKKGFAIKETTAMYGARLLADIQEQPERYFQRREIARTSADLTKFRRELFNIYQTMRYVSDAGTWYENENQCRATFPCPYLSVCYGSGADAVCDGETTPPGFKRIFTDLTSEGAPGDAE